MNLLSGTTTKTFNLLSIGQRGVGKTVFLAGSYAELHSDNQNQQQVWFDSKDSQAQENIEAILRYITQTGQYPPPTMKITNFNFSLKRRSPWGTQTLCHFRWSDIPGEICNAYNPDFEKMVLSSHGCCVFINANSLIHDKAYLQALEDIVDQVVAIASLVHQYELKYAFALILTMYDLLEPGLPSLLQIEKNLQPLITGLDATKANHQRFYSAIPIVSTEGTSTLKATGAAAPLLWLMSELNKFYNFQPQQNLASGLMQGLPKSADKASVIKKGFGLSLPSTVHRYGLILAIAGIGLLGVLVAFFVLRPLSPEQSQAERQVQEYEQVLQREPDNPDALINLANLHIQYGQPDQAIPLMEKLVQQQPENLDLHLSLAQLYELTGQKQRAETTYDQILAKQENHLMALISKAVLRSEQGDTRTAKTLFAQAEKAAPNDFKPKIRAIAQDSLK